MKKNRQQLKTWLNTNNLVTIFGKIEEDEFIIIPNFGLKKLEIEYIHKLIRQDYFDNNANLPVKQQKTYYGYILHSFKDEPGVLAEAFLVKSIDYFKS